MSNQEKGRFEFDGMKVHKIEFFTMGSHTPKMAGISVLLDFKYMHDYKSIRTNEVTIELRKMSPETQEAYQKFIDLASKDAESLVRSEFNK